MRAAGRGRGRCFHVCQRAWATRHQHITSYDGVSGPNPFWLQASGSIAPMAQASAPRPDVLDLALCVDQPCDVLALVAEAEAAAPAFAQRSPALMQYARSKKQLKAALVSSDSRRADVVQQVLQYNERTAVRPGDVIVLAGKRPKTPGKGRWKQWLPTAIQAAASGALPQSCRPAQKRWL